MKLRLNLDVIVQAALRQKLTPNVYVCVPELRRGAGGRRWSDITYLLKMCIRDRSFTEREQLYRLAKSLCQKVALELGKNYNVIDETDWMKPEE